MKKNLVCICVLLALCGNAFAQSRDIGLQVGLNVPMSDKSMIGSDMMLGVSYGQFHYNVPVAFAYRTKSKSAQERFETGLVGARDAMVYRHPYGKGDAGGFLGGFLVNLFSDMEFFAGMTPGYIAGASERPGRTSWGTSRLYWEDTWVEKKNAFSLTLYAGMTLNYSLWRFDLKLTPAFHYNLTNNYLYHVDSGENGPEVLKSTTTPLRWFFTLNGGLAFRF